MKGKITQFTTTIAFICLLTGCQSASLGKLQDDVKPHHETGQENLAPQYGNFETEQLYQLLVGELAGMRGDFDLALENYAHQAVATRDIQIVERAARIADYSNNAEATLQMALLWSELAPLDPTARRLAGISLARHKRFLEALPHAIFSLEQGDSQPLMTIAVLADSATNTEKLAILEQYRQIDKNMANNYWLVLTEAMLLRSSNQPEPALKKAGQALKLDPESESARLLVAQLQFHLGEKQLAIQTLEKGMVIHPDSKRLQIQRVRFLADTDLMAAREALSELQNRYPDDIQLAFTLINSNFQLGLIDEARRGLLRLTKKPAAANQAFYQLGLLEQDQDNWQQAIDHYRRVTAGQYVVPAAARLAQLMAEHDNIENMQAHLQKLRIQNPEYAPMLFQVESELLIEQQRPEHAYGLLSEALVDHPDSIPLLYARSLASEKTNNFPQAEADLRAILDIDDDNAMALNALGYTLTLHTTRYQEAYELIRRALEIEPDDAAMLDSLGWVLYHLGRHDEAIVQLEKALALLPDPEIAAHLGEVYWVTGKPEKARQVWEKVLEREPENQLILETMERLQLR